MRHDEITTKRKLNTKSIKDKYHALKEVDDNPKAKVALKYGIPKNTLSTWLNDKEKIFDAVKKGNNSKRQSLKEESFGNLDQTIFKWLLIIRNVDVVVPALILKTKAMEFAEKMNAKDFHRLDSWSGHWKKRYKKSFKTVSGEASACTSEMVTPWEETMLPTILSKDKLNQIYNVHELGSFYQV